MRKRILFLSIFTLSASILLSSCGVMFGGSKYYANIKVKDHPNAEIYANGERMGTGEVKGLFNRNQTLKVEVKQDGCEPKTKNFDKSFRTGNFILSALSWGLAGIAIDLGTGASYKPAHNIDPDIKKLTDKNYEFMVDYSECKQP